MSAPTPSTGLSVSLDSAATAEPTSPNPSSNDLLTQRLLQRRLGSISDLPAHVRTDSNKSVKNFAGQNTLSLPGVQQSPSSSPALSSQHAPTLSIDLALNSVPLDSARSAMSPVNNQINQAASPNPSPSPNPSSAAGGGRFHFRALSKSATGSLKNLAAKSPRGGDRDASIFRRNTIVGQNAAAAVSASSSSNAAVVIADSKSISPVADVVTTCNPVAVFNSIANKLAPPTSSAPASSILVSSAPTKLADQDSKDSQSSDAEFDENELASMRDAAIRFCETFKENSEKILIGELEMDLDLVQSFNDTIRQSLMECFRTFVAESRRSYQAKDAGFFQALATLIQHAQQPSDVNSNNIAGSSDQVILHPGTPTNSSPLGQGAQQALSTSASSSVVKSRPKISELELRALDIRHVGVPETYVPGVVVFHPAPLPSRLPRKKSSSRGHQVLPASDVATISDIYDLPLQRPRAVIFKMPATTPASKPTKPKQRAAANSQSQPESKYFLPASNPRSSSAVAASSSAAVVIHNDSSSAEEEAALALVARGRNLAQNAVTSQMLAEIGSSSSAPSTGAANNHSSQTTFHVPATAPADEFTNIRDNRRRNDASSAANAASSSSPKKDDDCCACDCFGSSKKPNVPKPRQ